MNGLIQPKHWRFNWPMLMGHLQLTSGHLSRTSTGHLAKCADPCECTVPAYTGCASCTTSDYGPALNQGDATLTVSGSSVAYPIALGGSDPCNGTTPSSCPSVNATYVIPCGTTVTYYHAVFVCSNIVDWYYGISIRFYYANALNQVEVRIDTVMGSTYVGGPNPAATLSTTAWSLLVYARRYRELVIGATPTYHDIWYYENTGACRTECNTPSTKLHCLSGSQSALSDTNSYGGSFSSNGCSIGSLALATSIA